MCISINTTTATIDEELDLNTQITTQPLEEPLTIQPHRSQPIASTPRILPVISHVDHLGLGITQGSATAPATYLLIHQATLLPETAAIPSPHSGTNLLQ